MERRRGSLVVVVAASVSCLLTVGVATAAQEGRDPAAPQLAGLALKAGVVAGCKSVTGTVTLTAPAPAGGLGVLLSDTLTAAWLPAVIRVPEGAASRNFVVKTSPVATPQSGTVTATLGAVTAHAPLTVRPMGVRSVTLSPTPAPGSTFVDGLVRLECNAGPGAITVALGTSQNGVARPASGSVTVAAGDSTVAFGVVTAPVAKAASAVISAAANTIVKTRRLAVTPAAPGQAINLVFVEGRQLKRVALDGTVVGTLPIEGPFAIGEDRAQILHVKGTTGFDNAVWLYDLATGDDTLIVAAPWASSLDWIPGSTSRFVYNRNGALYLHDLSAGTSSLWQDRDTALALFGQDDYRGVAFAAPGGVLTKVLTRIGHAGGGGDGVFLGTYCAGDARHHLCGLTAVSDPAGDSASWATIAAGPAISSDGDLAFFTQRIDWYTHRIVRKDLVSGEAHTLLEERTTSGDTGFGDLTLLEDRYLVFRGPCEGSDGPVRVCDAVTGACPTLAIATPGTSCGGPAVAVRW